MKKTKKLWKVWNVLAVIAAFLVTFSVVYASLNYFYNTYGTPGALSDGILEVDEWDHLMQDLDTYACPEQESQWEECPSCEWTMWYTSPDGNHIRKYKSNFELTAKEDNHDWYLYGYNGSWLNWVAIANQVRQCKQSWWQETWNMANIADSSDGTQFCGLINTQCENRDYYVHGRHYWIKIGISCRNSFTNDNYVTITKKSRVSQVHFPKILGIDNFTNDYQYIELINKS